MGLREQWLAAGRTPWVRTSLFVLGCVLMLVSPAAGVLPGPGGIFVFAAGLALALKNSEWAKRKYVAFKRSHPRKGAWADWGMRRGSAKRREELRKQRGTSVHSESVRPERSRGIGSREAETSSPTHGLGCARPSVSTSLDTNGGGVDGARLRPPTD